MTNYKVTFRSFFVFFLLTFVTAFFISKFLITVQTPWFISLKKPSFYPPAITFSIVWAILYLDLAFIGSLIWNRRKDKYRALGLTAWFVQLLFIQAWPIVFFSLNSLGLSLALIYMVWAISLLCLITCFEANKLAGYLMIPYLGWITFASVLFTNIYYLNV